jgi:mannitol-specific phosphotransferase system IIBC component
MPNVGALAIVGVLSLLFITIGYIIFDRLQRNFAEEL